MTQPLEQYFNHLMGIHIMLINCKGRIPIYGMINVICHFAGRDEPRKKT